MPTPLDLLLRHAASRGPQAAPRGLGAACAEVAPGADLCRYRPGPKEPQVEAVLAAARRRYRESLSLATPDRAALMELVADVMGRRPASRANLLRAVGDAVRARVAYTDDRRGVDTVQSLAASLRRGRGDCVSLTIAVSALAATLLPSARIAWRIGGDADDPSRHIWPVIDGVPLDAADPRPPVGEEIYLPVTREVRP